LLQGIRGGGGTRIIGRIPFSRYPVSCAVCISLQVELALIHFIAPNSSFLGHLCGIAAGLAYVHGVANCMSGDRECFLPGRIGKAISLSMRCQPNNA
jgi:hypothetical protein